MTGEWEVLSNRINGKEQYAVYRIKDTSQLMHSGNIEYATGYMPDEACAQAIADEMNREAKRKAKDEKRQRS